MLMKSEEMEFSSPHLATIPNRWRGIDINSVIENVEPTVNMSVVPLEVAMEDVKSVVQCEYNAESKLHVD